jgi:hypothetical protein
MLTSQSFLLAANRAANNMSMALKAQSQCRCTVEAINKFKNPKSVTITKQADISDQ